MNNNHHPSIEDGFSQEYHIKQPRCSHCGNLMTYDLCYLSYEERETTDIVHDDDGVYGRTSYYCSSCDDKGIITWRV